jgi:hypothetical protein
MSDNRLDNLTLDEDSAEYTSAVKIDSIKFKNYKFFYGDFELPVNGKNLLVYGENGSGKSAICRALELLTQNSFIDFDKNLNIFAADKNAEVEFGFNNGKELIITSDLEKMPDHVDFINGLSIFKPMLDYKKLLKVHYAPEVNGDRINLYYMFRKLLNDYPVKVNDEKIKLSSIKDFNVYFKALDEILKGEFLSSINSFLKKYFDADIFIEKFEFKTEIDEKSSMPVPIINLSIDYKEYLIDKYHTFLNEARLSALAISIYMVAIKKLLDMLETDCLKMLVLDDLLISLDMSNRLKLPEILKNEFKDFQIFFFTHDKELFEIYKDKMDWEKYEIYLDDSRGIPMAILKQGRSELERAKMFYAQKEYDACALLLRKGFEKKLKSYLTTAEQRNKNCEELDLAGLIGRAISKSSGESENILQKLNSDRQHILNPLCHIHTKTIHSEELGSVDIW